MSGLLQIFSKGPFGNAVAHYIQTAEPNTSLAAVEDLVDATISPSADMYVVAAGSPVTKLCLQLDEFCHLHRKSFLPLTIEDGFLRVGPIITPGKGSCWHCWKRRLKQHDPWAKRRAALDEHYAQHPHEGPQGFLLAHAVLGAEKLLQTVAEIQNGTATPGSVWQFDLITREIFTGIAAGIHGCTRCGIGRSAERRSYDLLAEQLSYLWEASPTGIAQGKPDTHDHG